MKLRLIPLFAGLLFLIATQMRGAEEINVTRPIAEVRLKDGKTLKNVLLISYAESSAMARWDGGRGTITYINMPDELVEAIGTRRPAPTPAKKPAPIRIGAPPMSEDPPAPIMAPPAYSEQTERTAISRRITGQVFVTTQGGNNYKLGAVRVAVYHRQTISEWLAWAVKEGSGRANHFEKMSNQHSRMGHYETALKYANLMREELGTQQKYLPDAPAETMTDADGRFALEHRVPEPYTITAYAQRRVGDDVERYEWRVKSEEIPKSGEVLLHNGNMK